MRKNRPRSKCRSHQSSKKGTVDLLRKAIMNLEQRKRIYLSIQKVEALLDYAIRTADKSEEDRLRRELFTLIKLAE